MQQALDELPEVFRTPIILYYFEDFSYRDIAEQMDLPIGTVMSRLARAKAHLRARLLQPAAGAWPSGPGGRPMDCRTARLLLNFARPRSAELQLSETAALEAHLADCPDFAAAYRVERLNDERIGAAMRAVAIPEGLQTRLLHRLTDERSKWQRRWIGRGAAALAVAASLFLVVYLLLYSGRPAPDVEFLGNAFIRQTAGNPDSARDFFKDVYHLDVEPPADFDYRLLSFCGVIEHKQKIPVFVFARTGEHNVTYFAQVFVLSEKNFDLKDVLTEDDSKGVYRSRLIFGPAGTAYLVLYTGDRLDAFYRPKGEG